MALQHFLCKTEIVTMRNEIDEIDFRVVIAPEFAAGGRKQYLLILISRTSIIYSLF